VPGITQSWAQPIEMRMDDLLHGVMADLAIVIHGTDSTRLHNLAQQIAHVVSSVPGAADVEVKQTVGQPYLRVVVKRDAIARHGFNATQVLDLVEALGGRTVGTMKDGDEQYNIRVRLTPQDRDSIEQIQALRVRNGTGASVPLGELADIQWEPGPSQIEREQGKRIITVQANVRERPLAGFVSDAQQAVAQHVRLPPGYTVSWDGSFQDLQDAMARLSGVVPVALSVIFVLLYLMFGRARLAMLIFFNVPFAAIGGIFALAVRGMPFSISAAVGFIALFGIAILNGVVMVSYMEELRAAGLGATAAQSGDDAVTPRTYDGDRGESRLPPHGDFDQLRCRSAAPPRHRRYRWPDQRDIAHVAGYSGPLSLVLPSGPLGSRAHYLIQAATSRMKIRLLEGP
jgi:cobalt-zinc-cadmium resistance protein CzcA